MMSAQVQSEVFCRRDIQRVLDALDEVNKDMAGNAPTDEAMGYYR